MAQYRGSVAWFNNAKGFGSLKRDSEADVFVHFTAIQSEGYKTLSEGSHVDFDIEIGPSGKVQASNVRLSGEHQQCDYATTRS